MTGHAKALTDFQAVFATVDSDRLAAIPVGRDPQGFDYLPPIDVMPVTPEAMAEAQQASERG